jgi:Icc-related predicted phosphoesterase
MVSNKIRIAAVGDVHCKKNSQGTLLPVFKSIADSADILVLCGDLTDYGTVEETQVLLKELGPALKLPCVGVLGNHDFESGKENEVAQMLIEAGVSILDGEAVEIAGIGFAGCKGFAGGFGKGVLGAWGEPAIKAFAHESINETLKLESALARLRTRHRVVVLHYAPIQATVEGEPREIFPYLGTSRLEEPINRHGATLVFHGHAHSGSPEGKTATGVPVYNVAMPLLKKTFADQLGFRLFELDLTEEANTAEAAAEAATHTAQAAGTRTTPKSSKLS